MPPRSLSATAAPPVGGRPHLAALDGLRFVAAMHIVLFHTMHLPWLLPVAWGSTSTSLFFLLSGFVLTYAYTGSGGGLRVSTREFWVRRTARLLPLAVLTQLATIPFSWDHYAPAERIPRAVAVLAGVQGWFPRIADSFNSPGWSVSVLMFCYLAFPAAAAMTRGWSVRRLGFALGVVWLWCLAPAAAYLLADGGTYWLTVVYHHPLSRLPEFLFGLVLARLLLAMPLLPVPRGTAAVGMVLLAGTLLLLPVRLFPLAHNGLLAPLHGLLIVGLTASGGWLVRVLSTRPMRELGKASFALFLLHVPLYAWTMMPLAPVLTPLPLAVRAAAYGAWLVFTAAAAWAVQRWVADPIARFVRRRAAQPLAVVPGEAPAPLPLPA